MAVVLVAGELVARFVLGLGDPPLYVADPDVEYLYRPSSEYRRFGRRVAYNAWSMRSEAFPKHKTDPTEFRVLVLGDSVINGGSLTDQADLATERLRRSLTAELGRPVIVGNASAGSWGPPNLLAYVRKFGLFDTDVVAIVVSAGDATDVPTGEQVVGIDPDFPDHRPALALWEGLTRYAPRYLPWRRSVRSRAAPDDAEQRSLEALRELIRLGRAGGARVLLVLHWQRVEAQLGREEPAHQLFRAVARQAGAELVEPGPAFHDAIARGTDPYRDHLHPNELGQQLLAEAMLRAILSDPRGPADR